MTYEQTGEDAWNVYDEDGALIETCRDEAACIAFIEG